jgi:hypothetical protein
VYHFFVALGIAMLCLSFCHAQSSSVILGARSNSLGYASSCLEDEWAIFNNIAGLSKVKQASAAFTYDTQPSFKPFDRTALAMALPTKIGVAGIGIFRFGDKLYNEHILTAGFSNTFGIASLGIKVNYIQYNAPGFGSKAAFTVSFGGIARLTEKISLGAHIININQPQISSQESEQLPTILITGIAFKISNKTFLSTEIEKNLDYPATWKVGIEYQVHKKFVGRTGFNIGPTAGFLGFGFVSRKFKLDYAYQHSFTIASRHQASIGYTLKTRTE